MFVNLTKKLSFEFVIFYDLAVAEKQEANTKTTSIIGIKTL